jgi:hypothetical protein
MRRVMVTKYIARPVVAEAAIVEWPTGQVELVCADKIRFLEPAKVGEAPDLGILARAVGA